MGSRLCGRPRPWRQPRWGSPRSASVTQDAVRRAVCRAMNDPAVTHAAPAHRRTALRGDEHALYEQRQARLLRSVRSAVNAPAETIEDACSFAWLQLIRTQPEHGPRLFAWLRTVAVHEAIRLAQRDVRVDRCEPEWTVDPRLPDVDTVVAARETVQAISSLRERQRRILLLHLAGYSYSEIAERTGDTLRTVERQLLRSRGRLRAGQRHPESRPSIEHSFSAEQR
jgi:RNA polymerase sigma factor (sigma-70 family)